MKRIAVAPVLFAAVTACAGGGGGSSAPAIPGHGAISIAIVPNPIVARPAGGDEYDFPFDVVVRETGGRPVTISRVSADVLGPAGIRLAGESYDAARIRSLGFDTTVPANGELRYHFTPRKSVPDDRLFGGVRAELHVEGQDDTGAPANAQTTVTVTR